MNKYKIVKFTPYFPPHQWGLESHVKQWADTWIKKWYWDLIIITNSLWQDEIFEWIKILKYNYKLLKSEKWNDVWYEMNGYKVFVYPSFDIIEGFPIMKFWRDEYRYIMRQAKQFNPDLVQTHARFFVMSIWWGIWAKWNKAIWNHIEHSSSYVKLSNILYNIISRIYDWMIWKIVFWWADILICVSNVSKEFVNSSFTKNHVDVVYRWLDLSEFSNDNSIKQKFPGKIIVWFVWRVFKWKNVESLVNAYYSLDKETQSKVQFVVVWDWENLKNVKTLDIENKIYFTWGVDPKQAIKYQSNFDIHVHTSWVGWALATTLLQAMQLWCYIVATPNEWAPEVIKDWYNGILLDSHSNEDILNWIKKALSTFELKEQYWKINQDKIKNEFSWESSINKYKFIFDKYVEWKNKKS